MSEQDPRMEAAMQEQQETRDKMKADVHNVIDRLTTEKWFLDGETVTVIEDARGVVVRAETFIRDATDHAVDNDDKLYFALIATGYKVEAEPDVYGMTDTTLVMEYVIKK